MPGTLRNRLGKKRYAKIKTRGKKKKAKQPRKGEGFDWTNPMEDDSASKGGGEIKTRCRSPEVKSVKTKKKKKGNGGGKKKKDRALFLRGEDLIVKKTERVNNWRSGTN